MTGPLVSVLLPAYNAGGYLQDAVDSILGQSYGHFELLLLDDGSTDGSIQRLIFDDKRVSVIHKDNTGLADTLNAGIRLATGQLIARMDSDDIAQPDRFERQVAHLTTHKSVVLLGTQIRRFRDDRTLAVSRFPTHHTEIVEALARGEHAMCHPSIMARATAIEKVGDYWEHGVAEDWDLFLRMSEHGRIANLPDVHLNYRFHGSGINAGSMQAVRRNILLATTNHERRAQNLDNLDPTELDAHLTATQRFRLRREAVALRLYRESVQRSKLAALPYLTAAALVWPEQAIRRVMSRVRLGGGK